MPSVTGLVLAAGSGGRMNGEAKAFLSWRGEPLLAHAVHKMMLFCSTVLVGLRVCDMERAAPLLQSIADECGTPVQAIEGGAARRDTLLNLLRQARDEWVVLHDVARPFTEPDLFAEVIAAALEHGAASAAAHLRVRDGIATHAEGFIESVVPYATVASIHTPQACRTAWLRKALVDRTPGHAAEQNVAALLRAHGHPVRIVWGTRDNVKITYPDDLRLLD
jgi:2-C-methyl-D-erythritol 4-phosphate cytidylyltransferase